MYAKQTKEQFVDYYEYAELVPPADELMNKFWNLISRDCK